MSRFTAIRSDIWNDIEFEDLTLEEKVLYFYLLTSPLGNAAGYYKLPEKYIACDLKIPENKILPTLTEQSKLWKYDVETKQVFIPNFLKYNKIGGTNQLINLNNQVLPLAKCRLHVDFVFAGYKYLGQKFFDALDSSIKAYVKVKCDENPLGKMESVLLSLL